MRLTMAVVLGAFLSASPAAAQPAFELAGGFVIANPNTGNGQRGLSGEFVANLTRLVGVTVMAERVQDIDTTATPVEFLFRGPTTGGTQLRHAGDIVTRERRTSAMAGVRFVDPSSARLRWFARALTGVEWINAPPAIVPGRFPNDALMNAALRGYDSEAAGYAIQLGGGARIALARAIAAGASVDWRRVSTKLALPLGEQTEEDAIALHMRVDVVWMFGGR